MMARHARSIDVSEVRDFRRLIEEVWTSRDSVVLTRDDEELVVLKPVSPTDTRRRRQPKSRADRDAFESAAGSWHAFDAERFLEQNRESRDLSYRRSVDF